MRKSKKEIEEQVNTERPSSRYEIFGIISIAISIFLFASYFGFSTGSLGSFANNVLRYSLGYGAIIAPLTFFIIGIGSCFQHKNLMFTKSFCVFLLFTLSVLGLLHHIFIPVGEELVPQQLPNGGGLIGGMILNLLRKITGNIGALILLIVGVILSIILTGKFSFKSSKDTVQKGVGRFAKTSKTDTDEEYEEYTEDVDIDENDEVVSTTATSSPSYMPKRNVYKDGEFKDFTEGISKPSGFKQILGMGKTTVEDEAYWNEDDVYKPESKYFPVTEEDLETVVLRGQTNFESEHSSNNNFNDYEKPTTKDTLQITNFTENLPDDDIPYIEEGEVEATTTETPAPVRRAPKVSYKLPPMSLLNTPIKRNDKTYEADIKKQCAILEQTLDDFKVRAEVVAVTRGPSVTRFELEPAPGVKVSAVVNLADDIALKLAAPSVRIEAPIPGKAAIGIEAPNLKNDPVFFREVVDSKIVKDESSKLCIGLGRDISGNIITADLSKMPHLLVAGSTGSGKSVCINTIIAGILFKARPDEVKMILVDPKVVELTNYNGIPHLLVPVVTDAKKAASALHWAVNEMERRYQAFADNKVREITRYNEVAPEKMPYIVIIIDELSDLMMVAKVDVEDAILRLAQKARAAGIHLIIATQRPSVDVITGIVKANIPSRIAFAVSSQTDSRTILDMGGAEKLLGKGDMLFNPIGSNKPTRVQGAFVSDEELGKLVDFITKQDIPVNYEHEVTEQALASDQKSSSGDSGTQDDLTSDELFEDAVRLVMDLGQASSSMLQRRFRIGYTRAARLVDCMEELGIIGQSAGSKPRELIMSRSEIEERFFNK